MPLPSGIEGRVASLSDLMDTTVDVDAGSITIDTIRVNNRALHVGEQNDITTNTLTTIVTMPANGIKYITKITMSGEDNARWEIYLDSVKKATVRTTNRQAEIDFPIPWKILATEVVDVKATFFGSGATADFQATIWGYQDTP